MPGRKRPADMNKQGARVEDFEERTSLLDASLGVGIVRVSGDNWGFAILSQSRPLCVRGQRR